MPKEEDILASYEEKLNQSHFSDDVKKTLLRVRKKQRSQIAFLDARMGAIAEAWPNFKKAVSESIDLLDQLEQRRKVEIKPAPQKKLMQENGARQEEETARTVLVQNKEQISQTYEKIAILYLSEDEIKPSLPDQESNIFLLSNTLKSEIAVLNSTAEKPDLQACKKLVENVEKMKKRNPADWSFVIGVACTVIALGLSFGALAISTAAASPLTIPLLILSAHSFNELGMSLIKTDRKYAVTILERELNPVLKKARAAMAAYDHSPSEERKKPLGQPGSS